MLIYQVKSTTPFVIACKTELSLRYDFTSPRCWFFEHQFMYNAREICTLISRFALAVLQDYFTKHAKTMRSSALELFGTQFSINRRVMSVTDTFHGQH